MTDDRDAVSRLIGDLSDDLEPVRRIEAPSLSLAVWAVLFAALAVVLFFVRNLLPWAGPLAMDAFTVPGLVASGLTALLAALAAFELSLPDRSDLWAGLPLP